MRAIKRFVRPWTALAVAGLLAAVATAGALVASAEDVVPGAINDGVAPESSGDGETLLIVVGGTYGSQAEARAAAAASAPRFGDVQGLYVDAAANYDVLTTGTVFPVGSWLTLSGFRTRQGVNEFLDLAGAVEAGPLTTVQVVKHGGTFIGLGQEPSPDGLGPLLVKLPNQIQYQQ